jgi:hypothetical protein
MRRKDFLRARRRPRKPRGFREYLEDCRQVDLTRGSNRNARNILPILADLGMPASCVAELLGCKAEDVIGWYNRGAELGLALYELLLQVAVDLAECAYRRDRRREQLHNCQCDACSAYKSGKNVSTLMDAFMELAQ